MEAELRQIGDLADQKEKAVKYNAIIDDGTSKKDVSVCKQLVDFVLLEEVPLVVSRPVRSFGTHPPYRLTLSFICDRYCVTSHLL
jgi:hypothetical protein